MKRTELMKKIFKLSKNPYINTLEETEYLNREELITTDIYSLNIALSGSVDGGFDAGVINIAGKSKRFKTLFSLEMAKGYLRKYDDAILLFFDSEFGAPKDYFYNVLNKEFAKRVIHSPVLTVEDLRNQMMLQLEGLDRDDHVIFIVDSIGGLASIKETNDSLEGNDTVDMTRAKAMKSLFRLITPRLTLKNFTMINIGHTYQTLEKFSTEVLSGGTGAVLAADTIFFIGKQQEKDNLKKFVGWNFIINIEKSRYVIEKSKLSVVVTYKNGINPYSGMFDLAVELGIVLNPTKGYYQYPNGDSNKTRRSEIESNKDTMKEIVNNPTFQKLIKEKFMLNYENA